MATSTIIMITVCPPDPFEPAKEGEVEVADEEPSVLVPTIFD
jgi:hypothetical protein